MSSSQSGTSNLPHIGSQVHQTKALSEMTMYGNKGAMNENTLLEGDERLYFKKMKEILEDFPNKGPPSVPSQLLPHLYIGSLRNAEDLNMLERLNISHVLNMAGTRKFDLTKSPYPKGSCVKEYQMISAEDHDCYNIVQHFFEANAFINRAKRIGGKALVHCNLGVNRCGAVCAAYLLIEERLPLLEVITFLKKKRAVVLCNKGFRRQLLRYAMARGLIEGSTNGNVYGTLGTISKYLVSKPTVRPEVERQKERIRESEMARRREQERLSEKGATRDRATNGQPVANGFVNGNHDKCNGSDSNQDIKENGEQHQGAAMNGHVSEEDEEVAALVNQPPKVSRFLPRNSTIYSPDPPEEEPSATSSSKASYGRSYKNTASTRPYSPTIEFGTSFGMKPYQRSMSADIERCVSPDYDNVPDENPEPVTYRSRRRKKYAEERPVTVCGDHPSANTRPFQYKDHYGKKKSYIDEYGDDLESDYTPMINVFHLEHLDNARGNYSSKSKSELYLPMSFSSSEPNLLEKNAQLKNYVHIRPYAPSLEFIGRKTVSSGSSYSSGHYSGRRYSSSQSRPHSVYTDRPYSGSAADRPLSSYRSTSSYRGYSPEILPTPTYIPPPGSSYSTFSSSSSYRRGPISSALMRHSNYPRSYTSMY